MRQFKVVISGGGTGGHIYPALAIANALKQRYPNIKLLFVGAQGKMEMEKVPNAGYPIVGLWISGFQRNNPFKNMLFPLKLLVSFIQAIYTIITFSRNIAIGTGGFASGPILFVASLFKIPTLIQEQNSYPGITNKLLAKRAQSICVAYDGLSRFFPNNKIVVTGNPVRQDILELNNKMEDALSHFNLNPSKKTLLVLGGSLGAKRINELIESKLNYFKQNNIQVIWQCGALYFETYSAYGSNQEVWVQAYIRQMDLAYAAADFVISRAGASSVSELCIVAKPVIFIPSPNVAEDHQTKNAMALVKQNAAIIIKDNDAKEELLPTAISLLENPKKQQELVEAIQELGKPKATETIVTEIEKLI